MFKVNKIFVAFLILVVLLNLGIAWRTSVYKKITIKNQVAHTDLRSFDKDSIKEFDGTDDKKPIYIALNGLVYDVSAGREFYNLQGPYHYLAGKDSSTELNLVGGSIITKKYPVIGRFLYN